MTITSGTKFGPYEVESPIGAGGMGEVYRARDPRLDRIVAIKVLASHLDSSPELKQRFQREARALSALNHPNICQLYDVGSQDATDYLVMEFLEGETLADRLRKGPLPLNDALKIAAEIAEALHVAHRAGILHRDLKPGNVMLTKSGAKLMDFGLAKPSALQTPAELGSAPLFSAAATLSAASPLSPLTGVGAVIGTVQYMSPEQISGQPADERSDIFCFGSMLYEMLTGKRAFEGKSQISVASAILEKDPEPLTKIKPLAPAALDHLVNGCLAKDPEARWQNAADIARELRWIANSSSGSAVAPPVQLRRGVRTNLFWGAAVLALLAALLWSNLREHTPTTVLRAFLPPPPEMQFDFTGDASGPPVITPDGTAIAFSARNQKERNTLWVQSLNELAAKKLEGTEGAAFPFWSPDGKFLGFFADAHLKKIPASGGPVTILADAPNPRGGSWNRDNVIIYEPDYRDSLWRINASAGSASRLTKFESAKHTTHRWPRFLPDGKHFLFFGTNHSGTSEQGIYFGSLQDGSYKRVLDADSDAQYASGYLLYHLQSQLLAQKFDPTTGVVSGEPISVVNSVEYDAGTWHTTFAASQQGLLIYKTGSKILGMDLFGVDHTGKFLGKIADSGFYKGSGRFSPDGKRLAVSMGDPEADIWVFDLVRGSRTRLTFGGATHLSPSWSADGQRVVYMKQSGATVMEGTSLCARLANGGGKEEVLMQRNPSGMMTLLTPQWSPDDRYLLYILQSGPTGASVWAMPTFGDKKPFLVLEPHSSQARVNEFRLSPDGRWLAYTSTESGHEEVYVTHFPEGAGRWQVSQSGGTFPSWRGDSKEIWFVASDGNFHAATVNSTIEEFAMDPVRTLFRYSSTSSVGNPYDLAPDGQKIIITTLPENLAIPLVMVTNWTADLKK
ncbi:MAG TPA: protein kinase [Candidatus Dormibacteraeota bacterium]|nr:protein kinase [Candidatus Dormibacteraeota bacterium]